MSGSIPPLPNTRSWRGAQFKHKEKFTFTLLLSAVTKVKFIRDGMTYIILRDRSCDIIVLNVHSPNENENDTNDSFHEELELLFDPFLNIFSNRQSGIRVYMKLIMTMGLQQ
jgi:hypothetical protein